MGLKAPASGVGPAMFSQASRGLWAAARRGGSSESDSIIAYAWRGDTRHRPAGEPGAPGRLRPRPSHRLGPLSPTREERGQVPGPGPWRPDPPNQAWRRSQEGRRGERGRPGPGRGVPWPLSAPPAVTSATPFLCLVTRKPVGERALWGPWRCRWSSLRPRPQSVPALGTPVGTPVGITMGTGVLGERSMLSPRAPSAVSRGVRGDGTRRAGWGVNTLDRISKRRRQTHRRLC